MEYIFKLLFVADFQITVLLNKHYGSSCSTRTPTWSANLISNSTRLWLQVENIQLAPLKIGLHFIDICGDVAITTKAISDFAPWSSLVNGAPENKCQANVGRIY